MNIFLSCISGAYAGQRLLLADLADLTEARLLAQEKKLLRTNHSQKRLFVKFYAIAPSGRIQVVLLDVLREVRPQFDDSANPDSLTLHLRTMAAINFAVGHVHQASTLYYQLLTDQYDRNTHVPDGSLGRFPVQDYAGDTGSEFAGHTDKMWLS